MNLGDLLSHEWGVVVGAPVAFATAPIVGFGVGFGFAQILYSNVVAAAQDRMGAAKDEAERLKAENGTLLSELSAHGEDIEVIKARLAEMPRIHVGPEAPTDAEEGDVWFPTPPQ